MGRLTARECLAVLEERINNLADRFDRFEENQQKLLDRITSEIEKNARSINDLSHSVKLLMDERKEKRELDIKWKLLISSTFISFVLYIISEAISKVI
ncbi:MAG: hypothetical protein DRP11_03895 [Candidatus Aenigmatarchaeota archaeon]|nr:MAG: hypothetical protein DRP11_03895 [Candidatus Aenigmarchaeota archaeon]